MSLLFAYFLYCLFSYALAALLPLIVEGIGALLRFFALAVKVAVVALVKLALRAIGLLPHALWLACRGVRLGAIFLYFLIAELLGGEEQDAAHGDEQEESDEDLVKAALLLLGLPPHFTRTELDAAYKRAIKKAHPDTGGSAEQAQAVNAARDLLLPLAA